MEWAFTYISKLQKVALLGNTFGVSNFIMVLKTCVTLPNVIPLVALQGDRSVVICFVLVNPI